MSVFEELPLDAGNLKPIQQLHLQVLTFVIFIFFGFRETTLKGNYESVSWLCIFKQMFIGLTNRLLIYASCRYIYVVEQA